MKIPRRRHLQYILIGHRVRKASLLQWGRWFEESFANGCRVVGMTQITSEVTVSTVFVGIDHRYFGKGPPMVFETMVFGGPMDGDMVRYSSWDDAETGHKAMVRKARAAQKVRAQ